ncbi:MAG TPA: polyprenyl synthetase family protein [Bacteroidia bacterium]|nr:polyprenyl synthetase family protein [Bacteroidia bacterium]
MHAISEFKKTVEEGIRKLEFPNDPPYLYDPIRYILALEGKRMRPVLVLMSCELFGGDVNKALSPALGLEVFHNFTLMHDDIMDKAPLRRSKATVHTKWNSNVAILSGDTMFVQSCQLMMQAPDSCLRDVMNLFHKTAIEVCEGQQLDMDFEEQQHVTTEAYIEMISFKTAVLLAAALKIGALIAGATASSAEHIYEFGRCIGVAFQLKDDILDVYGDADKFGKLSGGDIIANKKTMLLITALEMVQGADKEELKNWLTNNKSNPAEKVQAVKNIFDKLQVRDIAEKEMVRYFEMAMHHLDAIPVADESKKPLRDFAELLMVREA